MVAASLVAFALAGAARADKPLIAVVPFTGPQAKSAEATVVRTLRKRALLVPQTKWRSSAAKLFAHTHSPDDVSSVAADVGAKLVITGVVKRDGRAWQLVVSVRDGDTGRSRDKLKYPLKGPRVTPKTLALLQNEVTQAFDHALAAQEELEPPVKGKKPPPPPPTENPPPPPSKPLAKAGKAKKGARVSKSDDETDDEEEPPLTPRSQPPAPPPAAAPPPSTTIAAAPPPVGRPRWAPYFDVSAGGSVSGRAFDFAPSSLPHFSSSVVGGLHIDLTIYPLAGQWRLAGGILAGLGLGATLEKPFWPSSTSQADPARTGYATTELAVSGGLRWRFVIYKPVPRPELIVTAGGGLHSFTIAKTTDMNGNPVDVGPPDVSYAHLAFGAIVRLHFAEWARIWAGFQYQVVLDPGSITAADEYGGGSAFGVHVDGGLDFFVWRGLKLSGAGFYQRYSVTFTGTPGLRGVANSAVDQYYGGVLAIGYEL